ncbi:MAG: hypothetical protein KGM47_15535, partial [Acidobacteriota bacterium]|nr:hypothetical protein [Acidobacteriota bacterium]
AAAVKDARIKRQSVEGKTDNLIFRMIGSPMNHCRLTVRHGVNRTFCSSKILTIKTLLCNVIACRGPQPQRGKALGLEPAPTLQ